MAHAEQLKFVGMVKSAFPDYFTSARTLEIGSWDINGTTRKFFDGGDYLGLGVAPGPGVDVVCQGQDFDGADGSFDTVISCEAMEHSPYWKETIVNMIRLVRPGGLMLLTCATIGRREHGTARTSPGDSPLSVGLGWEYYKNLTPRDFMQALPLNDQFQPFAIYTNWISNDLYLIGFKREARPPADAGIQLAKFRNHFRRINRHHALHSHYLLKRFLIALLGEEQYWRRPIRPW